MQAMINFSEASLAPVWRRYLPTVLVGALVCLACIGADRANLSLEFQQERDRVRNEAAMLSAKLERRINAPIRAAQGLVSMLSSEPDMSQKRFEWLARSVVDNISEVRNVAAAPDLIVTLVHPFEGNASVLGLDYSQNDAQRAAVYHVRDSGEFMLAGPLNIVQGGQALIGRFPVFSDIEGTHFFWGILSVVLDLPTVYANAGLDASDNGLDIALVGLDGTGRNGPLFYGAPSVAMDSPVSEDILFPNGSWELHARPIGGWGSTVATTGFRLFLVAAGGLIMLLVAITNHMAVQRKATISTLQKREKELEAARHELESLALHDPLTGLPNRRLLDRKLKELSGTSYPGIIQLDLDGFKDVNDSYGHAVGDQLLARVSERLRKVLGPEAILIRSGGDEFVVLLSRLPGQKADPVSDRSQLEETARQLIGCMKTCVMVGGKKCRIGISAGIHLHCAEDSLSPEEELTQADHAMYVAKQSGRNRFKFSTLNARPTTAALHSGAELLEALSDGEIIPYYQPQFSGDGLTVVGVEALARWQHPDGRIRVPGEFMDLAHSLKIEGELDHRILEQAKHDLDQWEKAGLHVPQVSVNVSLRRLNDQHLIESVDAIDVDPSRVTLEFLESICLDEENSQMVSNIEALKARGFRIEVDDFGTGYSSVTSLLKMRPHCFKIDRSLVQAAPYSSANKRLLASIAEMGHALNISVCAEGIETIEHLRTARAVGCTTFQGFLLAQPMPASDLSQFLVGLTETCPDKLAS